MSGNETERSLSRAAQHNKWLYESKTFADSEIIAGSSAIPILAHKSIISQSSVCLAALKPNHFKEGLENVIRFPDLDHQDVERALCFMYTGDYLPGPLDPALYPRSVEEEHVLLAPNFTHMRVYAVADYLDLGDLRDLAYHRLSTSVRPDKHWNTSLLEFTRLVYENTTSLHRDVRTMAARWVQESMTGELNSENIAQGMMEKYMAIPDLGVELGKMLVRSHRALERRPIPDGFMLPSQESED